MQIHAAGHGNVRCHVSWLIDRRVARRLRHHQPVKGPQRRRRGREATHFASDKPVHCGRSTANSIAKASGTRY